MAPIISVVIPLFNEEDVYPELIERLLFVKGQFHGHIEFVLVDDGSIDKTRELISQTCKYNSDFVGVLLSRNFGHQIAVSAGLNQAKGTEAVMVIDGDLQDPPELLGELYKSFQSGYDVVYAIRKKRKESFFKRTAYFVFYRLLEKISNIEMPLDSGDFCLMSRRVVDIINIMPEESRYIRGLRSWVGFRQMGIEYERSARAAGEPKYNVNMLLKLAYNGIFNFSEFPIKLVTTTGALGIVFSFGYLVYLFVSNMLTDSIPSGFTTIVIITIFFGSINLLSIGILGEYLYRVFFQTKQRPLFIIDRIIERNNG